MTSGVAPRIFLTCSDDAIEIGADAVEFVDENQAGDAGVIGIAPVGLGLGLDAARAAEDADAAIEHLQRAVDLDGEIHVARGVDDIQPTALPLAGGRGGLDGDAALRSCSMKSMVDSPSCTSPRRWILPVSLRIRSVVVVLPASTWAKIPMFR
jgi:hypothetical protein